MGLKYDDSKTAQKTTVNTEVYVAIKMSGETDGGLGFGADTTYVVNNNGSNVENDGTTVYINGAFGKLSMGSVSEADEVATLSDIGFDGIGTDDIAEARSGDSADGVSHNVNYSHSVGDLKFGLSARVGTPDEGYSVGGQYSFGDFYAGLGYNDTDKDGVNARDGATTSVFLGGKMGAISVKAMYSTFNPDATGAADVDAWGLTADYNASGAMTVSFAYSDNDASKDASYGIGMAYGLGGGASLVGGIGSVNEVTKADLGIKMSF